MSQKEDGTNSKLVIALYLISGWGVLLTIITELSHHIPVLMLLCGGNTSECANIANTPYAQIFGVSVAWWGLFGYVVYLLVLRMFTMFTLPLAAVLLGAEFYFLWVMVFVVDMFCAFCLIQFVTVVVLFIVTAIYHHKAKHFSLPGKVWSTPIIALVVFAGMALPVQMSTDKTFTSVGPIITYAGDLSSDLRLELYSDFLCGHCRMMEPVIEELMEKHPNALLVFRDLILRPESISPVAVSYVNAIAFTKGRDEFIKERREMFRNQNNLYNYLKTHLNTVHFTDRLKNKIQVKVGEDRAKANALNIHSTPTMVVYKGGKIVQIIRGYKPYEKIERFLK
ncbi:MAG TPA: thioredoxin domain-containing protein [Nitrospinota bacterium]|nr:thioredoxin domain-containing protein [Nitrospinota bacterium]|tara:strand:- start:138538 stop:139551 length:1014 start_codon:yes stop_codon:yes gene_type:complete